MPPRQSKRTPKKVVHEGFTDDIEDIDDPDFEEEAPKPVKRRSTGRKSRKPSEYYEVDSDGEETAKPKKKTPTRKTRGRRTTGTASESKDDSVEEVEGGDQEPVFDDGDDDDFTPSQPKGKGKGRKKAPSGGSSTRRSGRARKPVVQVPSDDDDEEIQEVLDDSKEQQRELERQAQQHLEQEKMDQEGEEEVEEVEAEEEEEEEFKSAEEDLEEEEDDGKAERLREEQAEEAAEQRRLATEQAEQMRLDEERLAAEQAEEQRLIAEQAEIKRQEGERLAADEREREETLRREAALAEQLRMQAERAEQLRVEAEEAEQTRLERQRAENERQQAEEMRRAEESLQAEVERQQVAAAEAAERQQKLEAQQAEQAEQAAMQASYERAAAFEAEQAAEEAETRAAAQRPSVELEQRVSALTEITEATLQQTNDLLAAREEVSDLPEDVQEDARNALLQHAVDLHEEICVLEEAFGEARRDLTEQNNVEREQIVAEVNEAAVELEESQQQLEALDKEAELEAQAAEQEEEQSDDEMDTAADDEEEPEPAVIPPEQKFIEEEEMSEEKRAEEAIRLNKLEQERQELEERESRMIEEEEKQKRLDEERERRSQQTNGHDRSGDIAHAEMLSAKEMLVDGKANSQSFDSQSFDYGVKNDSNEQNRGDAKGNKKKKKKKKARGQRIKEIQEEAQKKLCQPATPSEEDVTIEWTTERLERSNPTYYIFNKIFEKFRLPEPETPDMPPVITLPEPGEETVEVPKKDEIKEEKDEMQDSEEEDDDENKDDENKVSRKKLRKMNRLTVAELKQLVTRPELVEMHDVTARDPRLLLHLKAARNTVAVPRHWCFKRKYLQGKRGIEKPPFDLPEFIKKTGIMEMRESVQAKDGTKTLKAQMRERVRPKLGKMDIDYQKLHDAFFRWQSKPKTTIHGNLYYEGKEFETKLREKKPGNLTEELRTALGMPTNTESIPPPWLIAMQRYGPPPSYPKLKIRGLNAPIPEGCTFGYHPGGWGKPPVNEQGQPLYGDVFGTEGQGVKIDAESELVDKTMWGDLESESESESEEEEEEVKGDDDGLVTPAEGLETPSGLQSVSEGMETPDVIELRKNKEIESGLESNETGPALYTILPQKTVNVQGNEMMGNTHIYDVSAAIKVPGPAITPGEAQSGETSTKKRKLKEAEAAKAKKYKEFKF